MSTRIELSPWQTRAYLDPARFRVLIAGRQSGKTHWGRSVIVTAATRAPRQLVDYFAPTFDMARDIMWEPLKAVLPPGYIKRISEGRMRILLHNHSRIRLLSAEVIERAKGVGRHKVVIDEFVQMDKALWYEAIRPSLSATGGSADFLSTPKGYNWGYDLYLRGLNPEYPSWSSHTVTSLAAGLIPAEDIAEARATLDPRTFRQEYEASFEALGGRVYDRYDRRLFPDGNLDPSVVDYPDLPLIVGMDFNVNPMTATLGTRHGDEYHVFRALQLMTSNTDELARVIREYAGDQRPVHVCPDPSGRSRSSSAARYDVTDFTILEEQGFFVDAPFKAPLVTDRINNTQSNLGSANGRRRVRIHPSCAETLGRCLDGLTYKEGTSLVDKASGLDHLPDALGYVLWQEFNLLNRPTTVGKYKAA
jgi:hypothetical protein